jgi:hypothetical protein
MGETSDSFKGLKANSFESKNSGIRSGYSFSSQFRKSLRASGPHDFEASSFFKRMPCEERNCRHCSSVAPSSAFFSIRSARPSKRNHVRLRRWSVHLSVVCGLLCCVFINPEVALRPVFTIEVCIVFSFSVHSILKISKFIVALKSGIYWHIFRPFFPFVAIDHQFFHLIVRPPPPYITISVILDFWFRMTRNIEIFFRISWVFEIFFRFWCDFLRNLFRWLCMNRTSNRSRRYRDNSSRFRRWQNLCNRRLRTYVFRRFLAWYIR